MTLNWETNSRVCGGGGAGSWASRCFQTTCAQYSEPNTKSTVFLSRQVLVYVISELAITGVKVDLARDQRPLIGPKPSPERLAWIHHCPANSKQLPQRF